jgi:carotenoid cleavage dioxygenase-like enzyme
LNSGKAEHLTRFVRSRKFTDEEAAGKPIYRAFGTSFEGDKLRRRMTLESPVNVSIWPFSGRLLAFGEQSLPWELSPDALETIGECNFNGKLFEITPFSAHPKIDVKQGRLCNFGLKYLMAATKLSYWEFDTGFDCCHESEIDLGCPYSVHDYTLSDRYAAFYLSPYMLDIGYFVRQGKSIHDSLKWQPEEENVLLILSRSGENDATRLSLGSPGYCLHMIQSFEEGETLTIDLLETSEPLYPQYLPLPSLFDSVKPCAFVRITVDTSTWTVLDTHKAQQDVHLDFPALIDSSSNRNLVWTLGMPVELVGRSKYYDRILCFDWNHGNVVDTYFAPANCFLSGEPSVVPANDDRPPSGYLICPMWNAADNESSYLILNAFDLAAGPIAVLPLPAPSPLGFHWKLRNHLLSRWSCKVGFAENV